MRHHIACMMIFTSTMGCELQLDEDNKDTLVNMAWTEDTSLPPSPSNSYADDVDAAKLGKTFFFDRRMSQDEQIACATCHIAGEGWSDDRKVSLGVDDAEGGRHSMPSHSIGFQEYFFWDGRADSAWSQTLQAIESKAEMDFARTQVAHFVAQHHSTEYEQVFGSLPDLSETPQRAKPLDTAWDELSDAQQDAVNRVFANVGKSLEAYQRQVNCSNTRFDQWARGDVEMNSEEEQGAAIFINNGCVNCHSGVAFSDGEFHRLNVPSISPDDTGREDGIASLLNNPFNSAGSYSDDTEYGVIKLQEAMNEELALNAYKTPSLRGVTQRKRYGHGGQHDNLQDFMETTYRNAGGPQRNMDRDPLLNNVNVGPWGDELVAFLGMLACPDIATEWNVPEGFEAEASP